MRKLFTFLILAASCLNLNAQPGQTDTLAQKQMDQLAFMVGEWTGSGWMYGSDREKYSFKQTEKVSMKLDGTALLIEGHGTKNGKTIHNALAIVTFNHTDSTFTFNSKLSDGKGGQFKGEFISNAFHWYPNEHMRYIVALNDQGNWFETGEIIRDGNWFKFFEMTLTK